MYILCDLKGKCLNHEHVAHVYEYMGAECSKLRQPMRAIFALSRAQLLLLVATRSRALSDECHVTKHKTPARSNFPLSNFKNSGTIQFSSSSSTSKGLCPIIVEKGAHPIGKPVVCDVSWTGFHSYKDRNKAGNYITVNSMLLVIDHVVHDAAFQYHSLCISQDNTSYLNPGQTTVSCTDQPVYALKKLLIWAYPNHFLNASSFTLDEFAFIRHWRDD